MKKNGLPTAAGRRLQINTPPRRRREGVYEKIRAPDGVPEGVYEKSRARDGVPEASTKKVGLGTASRGRPRKKSGSGRRPGGGKRACHPTPPSSDSAIVAN